MNIKDTYKSARFVYLPGDNKEHCHVIFDDIKDQVQFIKDMLKCK